MRRRPGLAGAGPKRGSCLVLGSILAISSGTARTVQASDQVDYRLSAVLDEKAHRVHGEGHIVFTNRSSRALGELWFHLYLNAFENGRTLFLREHGGRSGGRKGHPGSIVVTRLSSSRAPDVDLWKNADAHSPRDDADRTDIRVPLQEPLERGQELDLFVSFEATLPEVVERSGYAGNFQLVAQWFPKLARLEPDGHFEHFAFHPFAEFYADFGTYDVSLDVPAGYRVGATGNLSAPEKHGARVRYQSHAERVHDFAWVASPDLEETDEQLGNVRVRLLAPPDSAADQRAIWTTLAGALPLYQRLYGPYPYPTLTVVHPPSDAGPTGGMEYPTFITIGGSPWLSVLGGRWTESVTAHELAHQWFQGLVATNEARYPFLDEGLASHAEWRALEKLYGSGSQLDLPGLLVSRSAVGRYLGLSYGPEERIAQAAADFPSFRALAAQVYGRTSLFLETLRRVYGDAAYDAAMRRYVDAGRFEHPTPGVLYEALGSLGPTVRRQSEEWFERRGRMSVRVGPIETRRTSRRALPPDERDEVGPAFHSRVYVLSSGVKLPIEWLATFADGRTRRGRIALPESREIVEFSHGAELREFRIDPEHRLLIDESLFDNRVSPNGRSSVVAEGNRSSWLVQLLLRGLSP